MIAPNVFPMLHSCFLGNTLKQKNVICEDHIHTIIYLQMKDIMQIESEDKKISFDQFYSSIKILPTRVYGLIKEYNFKNINNREWFYVEDGKIPNFFLQMSSIFSFVCKVSIILNNFSIRVFLLSFELSF